MNRHKAITLVGGAATTWPLAARAQQPKLPVIGFLAQGTPEGSAAWLAAVQEGLAEARMVEGKDFLSEFRAARNVADRLPGLAADLVQRRVAVIVSLANVAAARAAKAATTEIPIIFAVGVDPVQAGLVTSLNHPGGNVTGISTMNLDIGAKHAGLLRELLPAAKRFAVLVYIENPEREVLQAAPTLGLQTQILNASSIGEIDEAFAKFKREHADALFVGGDGFLSSRRRQFAALTARDKIPAAYAQRDYVDVGGLMSYGTDLADMFREVGAYTGTILKGAKPADLPVIQSTKFEFAINLQTARALDIEVPPSLLAIADEVIE